MKQKEDNYEEKNINNYNSATTRAALLECNNPIGVLIAELIAIDSRNDSNNEVIDNNIGGLVATLRSKESKNLYEDKQTENINHLLSEGSR